jgi:hypothetical protein
MGLRNSVISERDWVRTGAASPVTNSSIDGRYDVSRSNEPKAKGVAGSTKLTQQLADMPAQFLAVFRLHVHELNSVARYAGVAHHGS